MHLVGFHYKNTNGVFTSTLVKLRELILACGASQQQIPCQISKSANFMAPEDNIISFRTVGHVTQSPAQLIQTKPLHLVFLILASPSDADAQYNYNRHINLYISRTAQ